MFRLLRYFSTTSFLSVVVVAVVLGIFYHQAAMRSLIAMGESNNVALARVLSNALWPQLDSYLKTADELSATQIKEHPGRKALSDSIFSHLRGLSVVKVKMYDVRGRTVFSTEAKQIGDEKKNNAGFQRALAGDFASELAHRDQFSAFEKVIVDRDLLSTYIPIRRTPTGSVVAVFEVYDDATPFVEKISRTLRVVIAGALVLLSLLYGALFAIVRHADSVISRQYRERQETEEALRQAQLTLEQRVDERTIELAYANAVLEAEVQERRLADLRVEHIVHHDVLTGLPNRTLLEDRVENAIARAHRNGHELAILFLDLDRFKNINDSLGHAAGDQLLKAVALRLVGRLREDDTVARLGGDEFVVTLPEVAGAAGAASAAAAILSELTKPFEISGRQLHTDGSIGIALYPTDGKTMDALMRHADTAMYHAKESGRGNYQFFNVAMNERVCHRLSTETNLRRALEHGELTVHYQPLLDLATGKIDGAEALVRWPQPDQRIISPVEFIPIAEDSGLIVPLGEWVLNEACARAQAWQIRQPGLRIAVNLSARQFRQKNLVGMVENALSNTGLSASLLELELTEGMLMDHTDETVFTLAALHEMGVRLAIDDFGTGYSSFSYLKRFPINTLKIDHSFVRDIGADKNDSAIVTAIVAMAHSLGLKVTAEGVETSEQAAFLSTLLCDMAQGYYFGRPMPASDFAAHLGITQVQRNVTLAVL